MWGLSLIMLRSMISLNFIEEFVVDILSILLPYREDFFVVLFMIFLEV
jgi:hypothetical protein